MIDENGDALGVLSNFEAKKLAQEKGLDLIEISPNSNPPVCRISDYGKFNYERQKKEKEAKKNQVVMTVKEVRFNPNTDTHDIEFKTKHLYNFLMEGHKVKAYVMFKGRMITHPEFGRKLMDDIVNKLSNFFNELLMHLGFVPLGGALFMSAVVFEWETYSRAKSLKDYMMIAVDWGFILIGCLLVINTYEKTDRKSVVE